MTRDRNSACGRRDHTLAWSVSLFFQFDPKKSQPVTNPGPDRGRILSDATGEHQRIQSTQRRRECANPFLDLVAKQCYRFSRSHVLLLVLQQVTHVGTGLGYAEQPGMKIDHFVELLGAHIFSACQIPNQSGIEIAGAGAHRHTSGWGETHAGVNGFAVTHSRQARAVAEVCEDDPAVRCGRVAEAGEFFH